MSPRAAAPELIGEPIDPWADGPIDPTDPAALLRLHHKVERAVQDLLDSARKPAVKSRESGVRP